MLGKIRSKVKGKKHVEGHVLVVKDASSKTGTEPVRIPKGLSISPPS